MSDLYKRIEELCERDSVTITEMCRRAEVPRGNLTDLKKGRQQSLSAKNLNKIAGYFGVTVEYLMTGKQSEEDTKKAPGVSPDAMKIAEVYDSLDDWGKEAVSGIVSIEEKRMKAVKPEIIELRPRVKSIPQLGTSFAAGAGEMDTGNAWTSYTVPEDSPAEFAIKINGDSMEPYLHDGSVALCTRDNPRDGDVAALLIDGDFLVKQVCVDYNGMLHLFSLNRERKNLDRHIPRDDIERQIMCFGTVIMKKRVPLPRD